MDRITREKEILYMFTVITSCFIRNKPGTAIDMLIEVIYKYSEEKEFIRGCFDLIKLYLNDSEFLKDRLINFGERAAIRDDSLLVNLLDD